MMELILWRHAEAEEGTPDLARKLTSRGKKQAKRVAEWLHTQLPDSARILVSPAVRAQQTARELVDLSDRSVRTVDAIGPDVAARDVLDAADWPRSRVPIVIVGHQPTLGQVASLLLAGEIEEWSIKKGAVWWLSSRERGGGAQTVLRAVISPDLL
jgi:phosphohistidine phosphatase